MRRLTCLAIIFATVLLCQDLLAASTQDILHQADQARGNLEGVIWEAALESVEKTRVETMTFEVRARGFDILAENLAPPKSKGNKILMLLLGNAVYGDIAATNYAGEYEATMLEDDNVNGEVCYVFDLKSKDSKTTYDRIKYWIAKDRVVGVKAEYLTVSGKQFKSSAMEYAHTVEINGQARPFISRIVIYDELMSNDITTLVLRRPRLQSLPDYIFDLNLLRK
jgi:hypothetical protein